jgi:O-antigen/teichoic acid export membrane protein
MVRLFGAAIADQIVLSAANFLVGFILIRFATDRDYALYVLIQSALLFVTAASSSWISAPLAVLAPRKPPQERRDMVGTVRHGQRWVLRRVALVALIIPPLAYLAGLVDSQLAIVLFGTVLAGWMSLRRDYVRGVLLIYSRPHKLLFADSLYAGALLIGIVFAVLVPRSTVEWVPPVLAAAAWLGTAVADASFAADPGWSRGENAPAMWREMRSLGLWSLASAVIYWLFTQSYNYVLAARLDLKAVADVNAARLILMPTIVLTVGIGSFLPPTAAAWYAEVGYQRLIRRLIYILVPFVLLYLAYFAVVWYLRDWLIGTVLHKEIGDHDRLLMLWAGLALAGLVRDVVQSALFAVGRLKSLAWQLGVSAALGLALTAFGIPHWGAAAALIGQIVGEIVNLGGILAMLRMQPPARTVPA